MDWEWFLIGLAAAATLLVLVETFWRVGALQRTSAQSGRVWQVDSAKGRVIPMDELASAVAELRSKLLVLSADQERFAHAQLVVIESRFNIERDMLARLSDEVIGLSQRVDVLLSEVPQMSPANMLGPFGIAGGMGTTRLSGPVPSALESSFARIARGAPQAEWPPLKIGQG